MKSKTTLHVLLVLSFIGAGTSAFSYLMMAAFLPRFSDYYATHPEMLPIVMHTAWDRIEAIPRLYYLAGGILYLFEIVGCVLMWKVRSSGFHYYSLSRLLLLVLPLLFLGKGYLGLGDIMFAALFIFMYYMILKSLGAFSAPSDSEDNVSGNDDQSAS